MHERLHKLWPVNGDIKSTLDLIRNLDGLNPIVSRYFKKARDSKYDKDRVPIEALINMTVDAYLSDSLDINNFYGGFLAGHLEKIKFIYESAKSAMPDEKLLELIQFHGRRVSLHQTKIPMRPYRLLPRAEISDHMENLKRKGVEGLPTFLLKDTENVVKIDKADRLLEEEKARIIIASGDEHGVLTGLLANAQGQESNTQIPIIYPESQSTKKPTVAPIASATPNRTPSTLLVTAGSAKSSSKTGRVVNGKDYNYNGFGGTQSLYKAYLTSIKEMGMKTLDLRTHSLPAKLFHHFFFGSNANYMTHEDDPSNFAVDVQSFGLSDEDQEIQRKYTEKLRKRRSLIREILRLMKGEFIWRSLKYNEIKFKIEKGEFSYPHSKNSTRADPGGVTTFNEYITSQLIFDPDSQLFAINDGEVEATPVLSAGIGPKKWIREMKKDFFIGILIFVFISSYLFFPISSGSVSMAFLPFFVLPTRIGAKEEAPVLNPTFMAIQRLIGREPIQLKDLTYKFKITKKEVGTKGLGLFEVHTVKQANNLFEVIDGLGAKDDEGVAFISMNAGVEEVLRDLVRRARSKGIPAALIKNNSLANENGRTDLAKVLERLFAKEGFGPTFAPHLEEVHYRLVATTDNWSVSPSFNARGRVISTKSLRFRIYFLDWVKGLVLKGKLKTNLNDFFKTLRSRRRQTMRST